MSREKLEDAKRNWEEKLAHYQCELAITADASRKFELRKGIQECEKEIEKLEKTINSSESGNDPNSSDNSNQRRFVIPPIIINTINLSYRWTKKRIMLFCRWLIELNKWFNFAILCILALIISRVTFYVQEITDPLVAASA